ncbi:hypothetical protein TNCV_2558371 [Trichonephila clavipes]|nr:hypothetical protein TNCV_2558371 [Trichonephila clavipes]
MIPEILYTGIWSLFTRSFWAKFRRGEFSDGAGSIEYSLVGFSGFFSVAGIISGKRPEVNLSSEGLMLCPPDVAENSSR